MRRAVLVVALLVLALAAGVRWFISSGALVASTRERVVEEANRALGRDVQIDQITGDPWRGIALRGVRIAGPPGSSVPFFTAPRITLFFDAGRLIRDLLTGHGVAASLLRVDLDRPFLALGRDLRGRWNYSDLLARERGVRATPPSFRAQVEVREGSLVFSDALRRPRVPFAAHFDRVTGTLDFGGAPIVGIVLDAVNTDGRTPALLRVSGKATLGEATFDLDLTTRGGSVAYWGPYLVGLPRLAWRGGIFDGNMHLLASRWGSRVTLDYRGHLRMHDGQALLLPQRLLLSEIDGPLVVDNLGESTDGLTMTVGASPVWVRGTVTHHTGVYVDLVVRSRSLDLRTLQAMLFPRAQVRLAGRAAGDARIVGPLGAPRLEGEIHQAAGRINQEPVEAFSGTFQYYGGLLMFDDVAAASGGGELRGHLAMDLGTRNFFVLAEGRNVDPGLLPAFGLRVDRRLRGRASGFVAAAQQPEGLLAQGRIAMGGGEVLGLGFDRVDTLFTYDRGHVDLDRLEARSGPTRLRVSGRVDRGGALHLALAGTDVTLRTVGERFGLGRYLTGTADTQGRLVGSLRDPALEGEVHARDGRLGPFPFDDARGQVTLTLTGLHTPGLVLYDGAGRYDAVGRIRWAEPAELDLTVRASDVPASRLLEIAEVPVRLDGAVQSTVHLAGPLRRPTAAGTAELRHGRIEGQPVDRAAAAFRWTGTRLVLDHLSAEVNASQIAARGSIHRNGQLAITFSASQLDLQDIALARTDLIHAAGTVDLAGSLGGSLAAPSVITAVQSSNLVLNGQRFTSAEGTARYRRGRLQLTPLVLRQDDGVFTLGGEVLLRSDPLLDLQVTSQRGELATLIGLAGMHPPFALRGSIDGTFTATGPLSNLRASLEFNLAEGRIGDHPIRQATVRADLSNHAVTLRTLHILPAEGELVGAGRIALRGQSEMEFNGTGLPLDLLRPIFGIRRDLAGTLDFTVQLTGGLNDPQLGLAVNVADGAIGTASFDHLTVQAFYRNGQLNVEHGLLQEDRNRVRLEGSVPFNPARLRFDETRPMNLRLELADADLSVLGLLTDRVERAEGPLAGAVAITGTVARPHFEGSLTTSEGTLKLRGLEPALTSVTGQVTFSEDAVRIGRISARAGEGDIAVSGSITVRSFRPDRLDLQVTADAAHLAYAPVFSGTVDAALRIGGSAARPEISGTATLSRGDVAVSNVQRTMPAGTAPGFANPVLDVELRAGDALWVNVGGLRLQVHGTVRTTGMWLAPRLSGEVAAERGTFVAFNNTFTLTEGRATFTEFRGTTPFLDAQAETRVTIVRKLPGTDQVRAEPVRVFLHISGTPEELRSGRGLVLSSDPDLPQQEILAGLAQQVGQLGNALFGPFGQAVARAFGLEEFILTYDTVRPLQLRIGKLLIRDLYVTLTREFGADPRTVWALEYRLTPRTMLSFSVDNFGVWDVLYRITYRF